tara:strand:- start:108 stop:449 length:342 start_codon:yes stop_codon:yes gene_type:complete
MNRYIKILRTNALKVLLIFCLIFISTSLNATEPSVLENQHIKKTTNLYTPNLQAKKSNLHYVFGPEGDRVVSVNYSGNGILISKTTYSHVDSKHKFIFDDLCKQKDCQQFIHD